MRGGEKLKWFTRVKAAFSGAITGWKGQGFDFSSWFGRSFWGVDNSKLATNETIFSVVSRLANTMASLPLKLYQNYDLISNAASSVLLSSPNPNMTRFEFIRNMETMRNETGNTYAIIGRDIRGQVERLTPLVPTYVEPVLDRDTQELWYKVLGDNGATYFFHNLDVLHLKHIVSGGGLKGINPIKVLTNTSDYDKAVREFSLKEMQSAPYSFILKYAANVDKDKRQQIIDDFKRFYQDNGGILFREPGVEIDRIERKYVAADTLTSERVTRTRVANVFNVPVSFLNDEGQSYSSNEQLMRLFVQLTLVPIACQYEQEFNRKLLTPAERQAGFYFEFNLKGLLRADTATQMEAYFKGIRSALYMPNEVRRWENLPPVEGGDKLYISGDLYPLDMDPTLRRGVKTSGSKEEE